MNEKIKNYIEENLKKGYSKEAIKKALLQRGISAEEVASNFPKKKGKLKLISGIIIFLIIAILLLQLLPSKFPEIIQTVEPIEEIILSDQIFEARKMVFASDIDGQYSYQARSLSEFLLGETVFVYLEVVGFGERKTPQGYEHDVIQDVEVKDAQGSIVERYTTKAYTTNEVTTTSSSPFMRFVVSLPIELDLPIGTYTFQTTFTDKISGKSTSKEGRFHLLSSDIRGTDYDSFTVDTTDIQNTEVIEKYTIYNPDGSILNESEKVVFVSEGYSRLIKIPERYPEGDYRVAYQLGEVSIEKIITQEKELTLSQYELATSINENFEYTPRDNNIFSKGEVLYLYLQLIDFTQEKTTGGYKINFKQDIEVFNPNGEKVEELSKSSISVVDTTIAKAYDSIEIKNIFAIGNENLPGNYIIKSTITDKINNQQITKEIPFIIIPSSDVEIENKVGEAKLQLKQLQ